MADRALVPLSGRGPPADVRVEDRGRLGLRRRFVDGHCQGSRIYRKTEDRPETVMLFAVQPTVAGDDPVAGADIIDGTSITRGQRQTAIQNIELRVEIVEVEFVACLSAFHPLQLYLVRRTPRPRSSPSTGSGCG